MIEEEFEKKRDSSRGMYLRSTSDILPKWKDIQSLHISPNRNDMRTIAGILSYMKVLVGGNCK